MALRKYKPPKYATGGAVPAEPAIEKVAPAVAGGTPPTDPPDENPLAQQLEALKRAERIQNEAMERVAREREELARLNPPKPHDTEHKQRFLAEHPELTQRGFAHDAAVWAWKDALAKGIEDDTEEMNQAILEGVAREMGKQRQSEPPPLPPAPARASIPYAAPVSREVPGTNAALKPGQVRLSVEQREMARIAGITEVEYAANLQKLNYRKSLGMYSEQG